MQFNAHLRFVHVGMWNELDTFLTDAARARELYGAQISPTLYTHIVDRLVARFVDILVAGVGTNDSEPDRVRVLSHSTVCRHSFTPCLPLLPISSAPSRACDPVVTHGRPVANAAVGNCSRVLHSYVRGTRSRHDHSRVHHARPRVRWRRPTDRCGRVWCACSSTRERALQRLTYSLLITDWHQRKSTDITDIA
jgi:hypothetical protein